MSPVGTVPKWKDTTLSERDLLASRYVAGEDLAPTAEAMGITLKSLHNRIWEHEKAKKQFLGEQAQALTRSIPQMSDRTFKDQMTVHSDNCIITSDWEIPDADPFMIRAALLVSLRYNIRTHIINGDFNANQMAGISSHDPLFAGDAPITFDQQLDITEQVLMCMLQQYDDIVATYGNHEDMINRATKGQVSMDRFYQFGGFRMTRYPHLWLETKRGTALILHPRSYRRSSVELAKQVYDHWLTPDGRKPRFVVVGHTHLQESGESKDGYAELYGTGCMRDPERTAYLQRKAGLFPKWHQGFLLVRDGYFYQYSRKKTNWQAELGDLYPLLGE